MPKQADFIRFSVVSDNIDGWVRYEFLDREESLENGIAEDLGEVERRFDQFKVIRKRKIP